MPRGRIVTLSLAAPEASQTQSSGFRNKHVVDSSGEVTFHRGVPQQGSVTLSIAAHEASQTQTSGFRNKHVVDSSGEVTFHGEDCCGEGV